MNTLRSLFPKAEDLLALEPDDLARVLLQLAWRQGDGMFWPDNVTREPLITGEPGGYPHHQKGAIEARIAVLKSFRALEEAVRTASGYAANELGVELMRKAFDSDKGPLRDPSRPDAERKALAHLFAGRLAGTKTRIHRTLKLTVREAQEQVALASLLLRIVDARRS